MTKTFKYFDIIMALFAVVLVVSNIASTKLATLNLDGWKPVFDGGTFLFPLTYIFGDVLTEVYGYKKSRRAIWLGMLVSLGAALVLHGVAKLPGDASGFANKEFDTLFAIVPQIVIASLIAFFVGEFLNAFVLAKLKVATEGKHFWARALGSTVFGQGADTIIFSTIAFGIGANALDQATLVNVIGTNFVYKLGIEALLLPVTYALVGFLKKAERHDPLDHDINFNPLAINQV